MATMKDDPFVTLGVPEEAGNEEIKRRYLGLVRAYPPDREPERFQLYRAAYEAIGDERMRLEAKLLRTNQAALSRLKTYYLASAKSAASRASPATIAALLADGIQRF